MQVLIAKETSRQLGMGDNVSEPHMLPNFNVGEDVPKDLGKKYGKMCYEADGFAQVRTNLNASMLPACLALYACKVLCLSLRVHGGLLAGKYVRATYGKALCRAVRVHMFCAPDTCSASCQDAATCASER